MTRFEGEHLRTRSTSRRSRPRRPPLPDQAGPAASASIRRRLQRRCPHHDHRPRRRQGQRPPGPLRPPRIAIRGPPSATARSTSPMFEVAGASIAMADGTDPGRRPPPKPSAPMKTAWPPTSSPSSAGGPAPRRAPSEDAYRAIRGLRVRHDARPAHQPVVKLNMPSLTMSHASSSRSRLPAARRCPLRRPSPGPASASPRSPAWPSASSAPPAGVQHDPVALHRVFSSARAHGVRQTGTGSASNHHRDHLPLTFVAPPKASSGHRSAPATSSSALRARRTPGTRLARTPASLRAGRTTPASRARRSRGRRLGTRRFGHSSPKVTPE